MNMEQYFEKCVYLSICGMRLYIVSIIKKKQEILALKQQFRSLESNFTTQVLLCTS